MSLIGTASKVGTTSSSIEQLLKGKASVGIASALGTTTSSIQQFLDGGAPVGVASSLGITSSELQRLRNSLDTRGAIGFILGLAAGLPK